MIENWPKNQKVVSGQMTQWKAVVANGRDILVAAAAGSGKTAVLVERIIKRLLMKRIQSMSTACSL